MKTFKPIDIKTHFFSKIKQHDFCVQYASALNKVN